MSQNPKGNALQKLIQEQRKSFSKKWPLGKTKNSKAHRGPRDPREMEVSPKGKQEAPNNLKGLVGRRKKGQEERVEEFEEQTGGEGRW